MRISWGRVKVGMWPEYERRYKEAAAADGGRFSPRARWLLRDLDDPDAGFTISLWESDEAMQGYSSDPAVRAEIAARFSDLFIGEFETQQCEVRGGT